MKFLKLELLNLASLDRAEGEVIDFDKGILGESNIFSIVGPTGSGKSTILDAICLALFNRAPRYPKKKNDRNRNIEIYGRRDEEENRRLAPSDCRNILTHGKKYGYSKLTFLANNGNVYRAEWSVIFKRLHYDSAVTKLYRICEKAGDIIELEDDWSKLPVIIGLDYEQFLRTVLIAQGAFASFLTAKEDERYELLEKLIGCEHLYARIAEEISARRKEASANYDSITAGINAYINDDLTQDELNSLKEDIERLETEMKANDAKLESVRKCLDWYIADDKLVADIEAFAVGFDKSSELLASLTEEQRQLTLHDTTIEGVNLYRDLISAEENIEKSEKELVALRDESAVVSEEILAAEKKIDLLKSKAQEELSRYEESKPHINRAREITGEIIVAQASLQEKKEAVRNSKAALDRASLALKENEKAIKSSGESYRKLSEEFEALYHETAANLARYDKSVNELREKCELLNQQISQYNHTQLQERKTKADKAISDLSDILRITGELADKKSKSKLLHQENSRLQTCNRNIYAELAKLSVEAVNEELTTLRKSYILLSSHDYETTRHELVDGEPCPLCGATVHPYSDLTLLKGAVSGLAKLIQEKEAEYKRQSELYVALSKELAANEAKIKQFEKAMLELEGEINHCGELINAIRQAHQEWPEDIENLEKLRKELTSLSVELTDSIAKYTALTDDAARLRVDLDKAINARETFRQESDIKLKAAEKSRAEAETLYKSLQSSTPNLIESEKEKIEAYNRSVSSLQEAGDYLLAKQNAVKAEIGEETPDKFEERLSKAVEAASNLVNAQSEQILNLKTKLHNLKGKEEAAKKNIAALKDSREKIAAALDRWLADFAAEEVDIAFLKQMKESECNWEHLRERLKSATMSYTTAKTTLENARKQRLEHQEIKPEEEREVLQGQRLALEAWRPEELENKSLRLKAYIRAREKMGLLYEKQKQAREYLDEWEQITQAIGGDGKTLRKIAQCYTLSFLIAHANDEIRRFNSRYELVQVKNSLGIRVIDHDRADDIRDTTSLSGGETFIVSLGLALGLSSLSSRNISFDNLFIDEGFGTLDPDTLATVIDSLASLQSSRGKKVGVISHTDTMSERISTQIRIIKHGNSGSSHIEIRSA